uniref:Cupin-like domain-containing protein n=1 Tax=viral metagenome TaxID=1070528 RepID=A0A6C0KGL0_9ZZZZ
MLNIILSIAIFCLILLVYLHVYYHTKVNNDLECFNITDEVSKERFEKICNLKQPFKFLYQNNELLKNFNEENFIKEYGNYNINVKKAEESMVLPMKLSQAHDLFIKDASHNYYSEKNESFLDEINILSKLPSMSFLKPPLILKSEYDIIYGEKDLVTTLKYKNNYRNYYYVTEGECTIKLFNPKSAKYLNIIKDYTSLDFYSKINPFSEVNIENCSSIDIKLTKGEIIFIPPYWSYSIKMERNTILFISHYETYFSSLSNLPDTIRQILQKQNVKPKLKKIE